MITKEDLQFLRMAMTHSQQAKGWVNPNPLVGAILVRDGKILAMGIHEKYGCLHAERQAFKMADEEGLDCHGSTLYVTLEPCCHHGKQPPCTDAIIQHGVKRVVMGLNDPNPLVAGHGVELLRKAGIQVDKLEDEKSESCQVLVNHLRDLNRIFLKFITQKRPWVLAKWAMTLDGKIATRTGDSKWISCSESRQRTHQLRHELMAILCGIGTVLADDPLLNCRLEKTALSLVPGVCQPIRMVADRHLRIPMDSQLVKTAQEYRTIVIHAEKADAQKAQLLQDAGVELWCCNSLEEFMDRAGAEKIDSILLEGGGTLHEAFLRANLVDEVYVFIAPKIIGGADAKTPVEGLGFARMADTLQLHHLQYDYSGQDIVIRGLVGPN